MNAADIPRLAPGVRLRFDETRQSWVVLAPERLFVPDEHALAVLQLVDGQRDAGAIVDDLAKRFEAPRAEIEGDVLELLQDLADKGVLRA
jgi:pyrroloquinoline quinone biosynthesis protein D